MTLSNRCVDCGAPTSGLRCRTCNGKHIALTTALQFEEADRALLAEGISGDRLAERLNVSRPRAYARLREARARQQLVRDAKAAGRA